MKSVAIITRTKNRPLMLQRTLADISRQTFKCFVWVVVNDGGEPGPVEAVVGQGRAAGIESALIHHSSSLGLGAASNAGIRQSQSEFIVLHDDDDTWEPAFLEKTVRFLRSGWGARYGGVVTHTTQIKERMDGETFSIVSTRPFDPGLTSIHISHMCQRNKFPPISFLYRREFFDRIGGYEEDLPVLDDWVFNLRFLLHGDIGVIMEPLANYHFRVDSHGDDSMNRITQEHLVYETDTIIHNRLLREDLQSNKIGLGFLMHWGRSFEDMHEELNRLVKLYSIGSFIKRKLGLKGS